MPDSAVLGIVGLPYSTAGCEVTGDLDALMTGRPAVIRETAKITITGVPVPRAPAEPAAPARPGAGVTAVAYMSTGPTPPRHPAHLVIESLPARTSNHQAGQEIISRVRTRAWPDSHPPQTRDLGLPIEDITDHACNGTDVRILITLRPGSDPAAVRAQLAAIHGITTQATWKFPAPPATMLRSWVDRYRGEDIAVSLATLEEAISRDRRNRRHR